MEADIRISYKNTKEAAAVAKAVSPDNVKVPQGLLVKTTVNRTMVLTRIRCTRRLETFISTIDDLLSAVSVAEKSLVAVKKQ